MDAAPLRSLYRYFMPGDTFVRILVRDPGAADLKPKPGLNRMGYRRMVIANCCPEYREDLSGHLVEACPEDPLAAEDLLYQLCVEVNPHLDIHIVRLPAGPESEPATRTRRRRPRRASEAWRERLARRTHDLRERLAKHIVGQDAALERVVQSVRKAAAGLGEERRPLGSFLMLGRTGTGKTELARALALELFSSERGAVGAPPPLVRIDCSEYALAHEYAKLIGAPPGYIGHDQGGILTDAVRKTPECVVLFDELEKGHERLHNLLLQVLDEGQLTDSRGQVTDFSHALLVMTSNVGAAELQAAARPLGFGPDDGAVEDLTAREIAARAAEATFSPEFLGRLDERVLFRQLELGDAVQIARRLLTQLAERARRRGLRFAFTPAVARWVAERGFNPASGARELRRVVEQEVEARLADLILAGRPRRREMMRAAVRRGELIFTLDA